MSNGLERFLGGSAGAVLVKLLFVSLLVGAVMAMLGISPTALVRGVVDLAQRLVDAGFAAIGEIGWWLISGALIVVPVFLLMRLLKSRS